jgi:serine/threonine protein kinase
MLGRKFGHYVITGKLGAGGMGEVYRAHDEQLDRDVALKLLPAAMVGEEAARKQFRKEALALARLNHPNIEIIFEFGNEGTIDFLAMELVPGKALDEILNAGPLPEPEIIKLGAQFADGLAAAHDQGIIHRDLKPGNLFITPDGRVKILDFGLAKLLHPQLTGDVTRSVTVQSGSISGTVPYMSPEQLRGLPVDTRSDIYAAGAVLYEMACGRRPYPQTQTAELMGAILMQPLPPARTVNAAVSPRMEKVISRALEKDPAQRYQSARELKAALQSAGMSATVTVEPADVAALQTRIIPPDANAPPQPLGGSAAAWTPPGPVTPPGRLRTPSAVPAAPPPSASPNMNSGNALVSGSILPEALTPQGGPIEVVGQARPITIAPHIEKKSSNKLVLTMVVIFFVALVIFVGGIFGVRDWVRKQLGSSTPTAEAPRPNTPGTSAPTSPQPPAQPNSGANAGAGNSGANSGANSGPNSISGAPNPPAPPKPAMPSNPTAASLYTQGLQKLRAEDATAARELLQKSIAAEPKFALSHAALAGAWLAMGNDAKARDEGEAALKASANLKDADRMEAEARYRETTHEWSKAAELYANLYQSQPANLEYGLRVAAMQIRSGKAHEALATVETLRHLPGGSDDSRVDLSEAEAGEALGQFTAAQSAAANAVNRARNASSLAAVAMLHQAWALAITGKPKNALDAANGAQQIFSSEGDAARAAAAGQVSAILFAREGNLSGAKAKLDQALASSRQAGDTRSAGPELAELAGVEALQGNLSAAKKSADDAVTACRAAGDRYCESYALAAGADAQLRRGNLQDAQEKFQQSLAITKDNENSGAQLGALLGLSRVLYLQGDLSGAKQQLDAAAQILPDSGDAYLAGEAQMQAGRLLKAANHLDDAQKSFEGAMNAFTNLGARRGATIAQIAFAGVLIEIGRPTGIDAPLQRAITELQSEKDVTEETLARAMLARALLAMGASDKNVAAQKEVNTAIPLVRNVEDPRPRLELIVAAARAAAALGGGASAAKTLEGTLTEAQKYGFVPIKFEIRLALGEIEMKSGKSDAGKARLSALQNEASGKGFFLIAQKAQAAAR